MGRSGTSSYIVEYRLAFNDNNPMSVLQKLDRIAVTIYNDVLNEGLKRMHRLDLDRTYQETLVLYKRLLAKEKRDRKLSKADTAIKTQFSDYLRDARQAYGFTEYSLHAYVAKPKHYFHDVLGINECQKLATRAYDTLWKLHTGKAEKVHFKRKYELISIENKRNDYGIRFDRKKMAVIYGKHEFPVIVKKNDEYAQLALLDRVKYVKLQPRMIRGRIRWYVQLVFEGIPPQKSRRHGDSTVQGIDIGVSTIAISNKNRVIMIELAPGIIVQRDMLSAYILEHTNSDLESINRTSCREDFERFLDLQNKEIQRLEENGQLSWYLR